MKLKEVLISARDKAKHGVSLVGKGLTSIPCIDDNRVEVLYLGNNRVCKLDGIERYNKLKKLSLACNGIVNMQEVGKIPKTVQVLTLQGNAIANLLNYRAKVISILPQLEVLDGIKVSVEERKNARLTLNKENELLQLIIEAQEKLMEDGTEESIIRAAKDKVNSKYEQYRVQQSNVKNWESVFAEVLVDLKSELVTTRRSTTHTHKSLHYNDELKRKLLEVKALHEEDLVKAKREIEELTIKAKNLTEENNILKAKVNEIYRHNEEHNNKGFKSQMNEKQAKEFLNNHLLLKGFKKFIKAVELSQLVHLNLSRINKKLLLKAFNVLKYRSDLRAFKNKVITRKAIRVIKSFFKKGQKLKNIKKFTHKVAALKLFNILKVNYLVEKRIKEMHYRLNERKAVRYKRKVLSILRSLRKPLRVSLVPDIVMLHITCLVHKSKKIITKYIKSSTTKYQNTFTKNL